MTQQFSLFARMGKDLPTSVLHELTFELKVLRVMTPEPYTLSSQHLMDDVKTIMRERRFSGIPIVDDGELVGIVSVQDLMRAFEEQALDAPVKRYMTSKEHLITAMVDEPVFEALKRLEQTRVGRLLVLDGDHRLVGMLTKGDIMVGLLRALEEAFNKEEEQRRQQQPRRFFESLVSDETSLLMRYRVRVNDFASGGKASAQIKQALLQMGAAPQLARRVAIATYEAEINLIIHTTDGGYLVAEIRPERITVVAHDTGPGIPNVELARRAGYSTASPLAREMGFGAGMGLVNIDRCTDELNIWTAVGVGTRVEMVFIVTEDGVKAGK